jgi:hypothetical protein
MAVIKTLNLESFINEFVQANRDYFSIEGYEKLYKFYSENDKPFEMSVEDILCDWKEYSSFDGLHDDYEYCFETVEYKDEKQFQNDCLKILENYTIVNSLINNHFLIMPF